MTTREVSSLTGLSERRIRQWAKQHLKKAGRDYNYSHVDVDAINYDKGKVGRKKGEMFGK